MSEQPKTKTVAGEEVVIKKYANRRLYDTSQSTYVTLDDLCKMVKSGTDFLVVDAKSGEDLTRQVLTQIIFEQESKGYGLLPINFLRHIIGFYDDSLSAVLPKYLEKSMQDFAENQEKMRDYVGTFAEYSPFKGLEEIGKKNMEMFEQTMSMFSPFGQKKEK